MLKISFFCVITIFYSQDHSITGKVIDVKSGTPIEFVNVYIENSTFGNTTNSDGLFDIYGLSPNSHIVIASYEGYITQKKTIEMGKDDKSIYIEFRLAEKIMEDSTVIVEANRIGKLRIKSDAEMNRNLQRPPKMLKSNRTSVPKVTRVVFEPAPVIKEETWWDWVKDNYTYVIIGTTVIVITAVSL